jgi:hypothetical protein
MNCKLCGNDSIVHGRGSILRKYEVEFFRCPNCGFIQTEEPFWLDESYSSAINRSDVGYVGRNIVYSRMVKAVISLLFDSAGRCVDFGGGYGMFVRLMRDHGYDFWWHDKYCENLFAEGLEVPENGSDRFELLTAFEVFEHLVDPIASVEEMLRFSDSVMFSTQLPPEPPPPVGEWFYYGLDHGQHVAIYSLPALEQIARRLNLHLLSYGGYMHLLSRRKVSALRWRVALNRFSKPAINLLYRRESLLWLDYGEAIKRLHQEQDASLQ